MHQKVTDLYFFHFTSALTGCCTFICTVESKNKSWEAVIFSLKKDFCILSIEQHN